MEHLEPEAVRERLGALALRERKIVGGLVAVLIQNPQRVKDREWVAEQLTFLALYASGFEPDSAQDGVQEIQGYLQAESAGLLESAFLLYQRVGLDVSETAPEERSLEAALERVKSYLG